MNDNKRNRLAREKSPYLLQHAVNPVDWYPWGDEAFEKAARENKPVFLSIGYSTCHWCHVMAHESFEDPEVGRLLNEGFVAVKVDREERPDIDMLYMTVCQAMTGSGGWPLTILMTPDRRPFYAGTYIPKESRYGRLGLLELLPRIRELWTTRPNSLLDSAARITATLQRAVALPPGAELGEAVLHRAWEELAPRFDARHGGFGTAPKFPSPHNLTFLLRYGKRTGREEARDMVEKTLRAMRRGGIHDHIGFGFHRYATDPTWLVPHFEKMLYDQALLATAYLEAYQATGRKEYARTAREIFTYVRRDMTAPGGAFYAAEDADSEGVEGKFYVWTQAEIKQVLAPDDADLFIKVFNIREEGNFADEAEGGRTGNNIPHLTRPLEEIAAGLQLSLPELEDRLEKARQKLFARREKRVRPHRDDKVLADWNGLMIAALALGARALDEPEYAAAARRAADFIFNNMVGPDGRLLHRFRDGEAAIPAHLDDYAFLVHGLLELYEATFEVDYLERALELNRQLLEHFWDGENGGFYFTADDAEKLLLRQKEIYDGAVPSGNSVAMLNLLRLARLTADLDLEDKAAAIGRAFYESVNHMPSAHTQLMSAIDFAAGPSYEVVVAGESGGEDTQKLLRAIGRAFVPNKVVMLLPAETDSPGIKRLAPFTGQMTALEGKATAYVCRNYACELPTTDVGDMLKRLDAAPPLPD
ncbi:MAG: thioredoxin domain-containing protein [Chloroflexota bacterium]